MDDHSPAALWRQANHEHQGQPEARRQRYYDLMVEHGHIINVPPGETAHRTLPCGWSPPRRLRVEDVQIGDTIMLPGHWLHDDLAGLDVELKVLGLRPYKTHGIVPTIAVQHVDGEVHLSPSDQVIVRRPETRLDG